MGEVLLEGLKSNMSEYKSEKVADAFLSAAVFDLALGSRGSTTGHAQFVHNDSGPDAIIAPMAGGKQGIFKATSNFIDSSDENMTTIRGNLDSKQARRKIEITMDPSHNETVLLQDANDRTLLKTVGGWSPAAGKGEAASFTLSRANDILATVQGTREFVGGHEKIRYTLYSPNELKMTLGTIDVDKTTNGGVLDMDIKINKS